MFVGDLFVQYPKLEVRFWYIAILLVLLRWRQLDYVGTSNSVGAGPQMMPTGKGVGGNTARARPFGRAAGT
jgi:hypothetical protein